MPVRFEILEHPADIGFRVYAADPAELFANAAVAMLSVAAEPAEVQPQFEYPLSASGPDCESLMIGWLNEVLYWFDGKHIAFRSFRITHLDGGRLEAVGLGEPRDSARHTSKLIVKAVTWHQLRVAEEGGGWVAEVYLDI